MEVTMSEFLTDGEEKTKRLKAVIDALAGGTPPEKVKRDFHELIKGASASEVAAMEQSLIEGGMPVEEVQRLCEIHADVFREGLEQTKQGKTLPGHPVHTFLSENREARKRARALLALSWIGNKEKLAAAVSALRPVITHYERKENQLFPYLEQRGFTGPSKVMWGKHDEIRGKFRALDSALAAGSTPQARALARDLARLIRTMIFMEEKILFPNAQKKLTNRDWAEIRNGEAAIGYAWVKPGAEWDAGLARNIPEHSMADNAQTREQSVQYGKNSSAMLGPESLVPLSVGKLPLSYLDGILKMLPFDISFVDAEDKVMYYSDAPHRVFPRSPAIIGRAVQNCHPPKSVATVEKILLAFRNKEKDMADFWIEMGGKFIYIVYRPLYDESGQYLGTLEMSMDATHLRSLTGQRRLLDW